MQPYEVKVKAVFLAIKWPLFQYIGEYWRQLWNLWPRPGVMAPLLGHAVGNCPAGFWLTF
jgi:hypothetical protein